MSTGSQNANCGAPKKNRWVWPLLIVSLALNLLFVGIMAGSWWRHGGPSGRHAVFSGAVEMLMQDLPEAKRKHAAMLLDRYRETVKPVRLQLREARKEAKKVILAEPFNEANAEAALARFREIRMSQHQSMHTMIMGIMKDLNFEERNKLLDNIQAGFRSRWRHRGRFDRKGEGSQRQ